MKRQEPDSGRLLPVAGQRPERPQDVISSVAPLAPPPDPRAEIFSPQPDPDLVDSFTVAPPSASWLRRFRAVLCCFNPQEEFLYSSGSSGGVLEPSLAPPTPPAPTAGGLPQPYVIGPLSKVDSGKKTLVLDLDETLVHSSFQPLPDADFIVPVDIEGKQVQVYVLKRPWLDHFMERIGPLFETVVFTASLSKYADPLLDLLDKSEVVRWRLFREACCHYEGSYVKDLSTLGRDLSTTIIVDNSPLSYIFQPANAVAIGAFMGEKDDEELLNLIPVLESLVEVEDVRVPLAQLAEQLQMGSSNGSGGDSLTQVNIVQ